jgi:hypothetical protein
MAMRTPDRGPARRRHDTSVTVPKRLFIVVTLEQYLQLVPGA